MKLIVIQEIKLYTGAFTSVEIVLNYDNNFASGDNSFFINWKSNIESGFSLAMLKLMAIYISIVAAAMKIVHSVKLNGLESCNKQGAKWKFYQIKNVVRQLVVR